MVDFKVEHCIIQIAITMEKVSLYHKLFDFLFTSVIFFCKAFILKRVYSQQLLFSDIEIKLKFYFVEVECKQFV